MHITTFFSRSFYITCMFLTFFQMHAEDTTKQEPQDIRTFLASLALRPTQQSPAASAPASPATMRHTTVQGVPKTVPHLAPLPPHVS